MLGELAHYIIKKSDTWAHVSYSQEGEDVLLYRLLNTQRTGFYVDVGAHHPKRFSNTNYFYQRGWQGINIEPNPAAYDLFTSMRTRDINLQLGISDNPDDLLYYEFDDPALNTFDQVLKQEREATTCYKVIASRNIKVDTLASVLSTYLPAGQQIDFLNVDVEGLDLIVLRSNDWERFRPRYVVSESLNAELIPAKLINNPLVKYMEAHNYGLIAKTLNSLFFVDKLVRDAG